MICPNCKSELGSPSGFDIYPHDDLPDGTPGGFSEEDQYICDSCRHFIVHQKSFDKNGATNELLDCGVWGEYEDSPP